MVKIRVILCLIPQDALTTNLMWQSHVTTTLPTTLAFILRIQFGGLPVLYLKLKKPLPLTYGIKFYVKIILCSLQWYYSFLPQAAMIALKNVAWSEVRHGQNGKNNHLLSWERNSDVSFLWKELTWLLWHKFLGLLKAICEKEFHYQAILTVRDKLKGQWDPKVNLSRLCRDRVNSKGKV